MYVRNGRAPTLGEYQALGGFWGDLKRKIRKNVKKIAIISTIFPSIGTSAAAIAKPVETAAVVATAGGAAAVTGGTAAATAASAPSVFDKAQNFLKDPKLKATLDAARSLTQKPKSGKVDSMPPAEQNDAPDFLNLRNANPVILGVAGIAAIVALALAQSKRK